MQFKIIGKDWGRSVVELEDGSVKTLDEQEIAALQTSAEGGEGEGSDTAGTLKVQFVERATLDALDAAGFTSLELIAAATDEQLLAVEGVDAKVLEKLRKASAAPEG